MIREGQTFNDYFYNAQVRLRPCASCADTQFKLVTMKNRHNIALPVSICCFCGLVQINPIPSADWYKEFYNEYFWDTYIGKKIGLDELYEQDDCRYKGTSLADVLVKDKAFSNKNTCRVLDAGCGLGGFLEALKLRKPAWDLSAIEPSTSARKFVELKTGIVPQPSNFKSLPYQDNYFDLITLVHVVEHVYEPLELLCEIRRVLTADGICYIEVPDMESPHWSGRNFLHIAHIYLFDRQTLTALLIRAGLEIYRIIDSPAVKTWPWAKGYFIRVTTPSSTSIKDINRLPDSIIKNRINYLQKKITRNRKSLAWRLIDRLGPGFPGPKTIIRLYRQFISRDR